MVQRGPFMLLAVRVKTQTGKGALERFLWFRIWKTEAYRTDHLSLVNAPIGAFSVHENQNSIEGCSVHLIDETQHEWAENYPGLGYGQVKLYTNECTR